MTPLKREIDAVVPVLEDPRNAHRTSEDVARRVIDALDEARTRAKRDAWAPAYPTDAEWFLAFQIARQRRAEGRNPWLPLGPVCRCGVRRSGPRDSGACPVHTNPD